MTRERVIDTATAMIAASGVEQLTIRGLAAELGVAPMSIYRHVSDKDDLLADVVDRLLATAWQPEVEDKDWLAWITDAADKLRAFLVDQPAALHIYLQRPVVAPAAIERMQAMMQVLRTATVGESAAQEAYAAIHTYTIGFAALEAARANRHPDEARRNTLAEQLATYTSHHQFEAGLHYLLRGIAAGD